MLRSKPLQRSFNDGRAVEETVILLTLLAAQIVVLAFSSSVICKPPESNVDVSGRLNYCQFIKNDYILLLDFGIADRHQEKSLHSFERKLGRPLESHQSLPFVDKLHENLRKTSLLLG